MTPSPTLIADTLAALDRLPEDAPKLEGRHTHWLRMHTAQAATMQIERIYVLDALDHLTVKLMEVVGWAVDEGHLFSASLEFYDESWIDANLVVRNRKPDCPTCGHGGIKDTKIQLNRVSVDDRPFDSLTALCHITQRIAEIVEEQEERKEV